MNKQYERPSHFGTLSDGALYDRRAPFTAPNVRENYAYTHREIRTVADLKATLRAGQYAWPGGYQMFLMDEHGETFSFEAGTDEQWLREAYGTIANGGMYWCDINYEDTDMECACTGKRIPSAYGEE